MAVRDGPEGAPAEIGTTPPDASGRMGRVSYREDLRLLKKRRFAALCAARTMSMLAAAFTPVALAFGVLDLPGATASTLSTVLAFQAMAGVLFLLVGGVVADRLPRSWVLLVAELSNFVVWMSMGLMLVLGSAPIWALRSFWTSSAAMLVSLPAPACWWRPSAPSRAMAAWQRPTSTSLISKQSRPVPPTWCATLTT